jgi:diguanylate cyclase (GGDEF)-like protein
MRVPRPVDEARRLAVLHEHALLGQPAEPALDQIVKLAASVCLAPIAMINLIDDQRQWSVARVGTRLREMPRDGGLCARTLTAREILEIPDTHADPRASKSPLLRLEPSVQFYAGVPLRSAEPHPLGTLCVMDTSPRRLEPRQVKELVALARTVERILAARRAARALTLQLAAVETTEQRLRVQHAVSSALAETDSVAAAVPEVLRILGSAFGWELGLFWRVAGPGEPLSCQEAWQAAPGAHDGFVALARNMAFEPGQGLPGAVARSGQAAWLPDVQRANDFRRGPGAMAEGLHGAFAFPARVATGVVAVVEFFSRSVREPDAATVAMFSAIGQQLGQFLARARSELVQSRLLAIIDHTPDFVGMADLQGRVIYLNRSARKLLEIADGTDPDRLAIHDIYPEWARLHLREQALPTAIRDGTWSGESALLTPQGLEIPVTQVIMAHRATTSATEYFSTILRDDSGRKATERALLETNEKLQNKMAEIERRSSELKIFHEMSELLGTCVSMEEAHNVVAHSGRNLFAGDSGALYLLNASRSDAEAFAIWGDQPPTQAVFGREDCWALRRGRPHAARTDDQELSCPHARGSQPLHSLCVPLLSHGGPFGVLQVLSPGSHEGEEEARKRLARAMAEHVAMALANLQLRATLRAQSIRDPLTGLFNRRYMDETLERELARLLRKRGTLGLAMLDLDNFHQLNEQYGHEGGDTVLAAFGRLLRQRSRREDIACRYGGEEFVLIQPDAGLDICRHRAEQLRAEFQGLSLMVDGRQIQPLGVSGGVAVAPLHGTNAASLLRAADRALYQAKKEGRNRIVIADRGAREAAEAEWQPD